MSSQVVIFGRTREIMAVYTWHGVSGCFFLKSSEVSPNSLKTGRSRNSVRDCGIYVGLTTLTFLLTQSSSTYVWRSHYIGCSCISLFVTPFSIHHLQTPRCCTDNSGHQHSYWSAPEPWVCSTASASLAAGSHYPHCYHWCSSVTASSTVRPEVWRASFGHLNHGGVMSPTFSGCSWEMMCPLDPLRKIIF